MYKNYHSFFLTQKLAVLLPIKHLIDEIITNNYNYDVQTSNNISYQPTYRCNFLHQQ